MKWKQVKCNDFSQSLNKNLYLLWSDMVDDTHIGKIEKENGDQEGPL